MRATPGRRDPALRGAQMLLLRVLVAQFPKLQVVPN
jgi:hypothetical protein